MLPVAIAAIGNAVEGLSDAYVKRQQGDDEIAALSQGTTFPKFGGATPQAANEFSGGASTDSGLTPNVTELVRSEASKRGIDPEIAVRVAASEGLRSYVGDQGSSFGPFQLHYGGMAPGGNSVGGLGDEFTKQTKGLHASDPSTVPQQVQFALDYAAKHGWGPWHGAAKVGIGNFEGIRPLARGLMGGRAPMIDPNFGASDVLYRYD